MLRTGGLAHIAHRIHLDPLPLPAGCFEHSREQANVPQHGPARSGEQPRIAPLADVVSGECLDALLDRQGLVLFLLEGRKPHDLRQLLPRFLGDSSSLYRLSASLSVFPAPGPLFPSAFSSIVLRAFHSSASRFVVKVPLSRWPLISSWIRHVPCAVFRGIAIGGLFGGISGGAVAALFALGAEVCRNHTGAEPAFTPVFPVWRKPEGKRKMEVGARSRNRTGMPLMQEAADFKSDVSTSFTIRAAGRFVDDTRNKTSPDNNGWRGSWIGVLGLRVRWRRDPESNRARRICNPLHNRFAIAPRF